MNIKVQDWTDSQEQFSMHTRQVLDFLPLLQVFLHPSAPSLQNLHLEHGPLRNKILELELCKGSGKLIVLGVKFHQYEILSPSLKILTIFGQSRVRRDCTGHRSHTGQGRLCRRQIHRKVSSPL